MQSRPRWIVERDVDDKDVLTTSQGGLQRSDDGKVIRRRVACDCDVGTRCVNIHAVLLHLRSRHVA